MLNTFESEMFSYRLLNCLDKLLHVLYWINFLIPPLNNIRKLFATLVASKLKIYQSKFLRGQKSIRFWIDLIGAPNTSLYHIPLKIPWSRGLVDVLNACVDLWLNSSSLPTMIYTGLSCGEVYKKETIFCAYIVSFLV